MKNRYLLIICVVSVLSVIVGITACNEGKITDISVSDTALGSESQTNVNGDFIPIETSSTATTYVDPDTGETVEVISTLPDGTPDETQPTKVTSNSTTGGRENGTNPTSGSSAISVISTEPTRIPGTSATPTPTRAPGVSATPTPFAFPTSGVTVTPTPKPTVTVRPTNTPTPVPSGDGTWQDSKADEIISILNQKRRDRAVRLGTATWYVPYQKSSSFTNSAKQTVLKGFSANGDDKFIFNGNASASTIANSIDPYFSYTKKIKYVSVGFGIYYNNGKTYVVMIQQEGPSGEPGSAYHISPNTPATATPTPKPTNTPTPVPTNTPTPVPTHTPTPVPTHTPTPVPTSPPETPDDSGGDD